MRMWAMVIHACAEAIDSRRCALHYPAARQDFKAPGLVGTLDDFEGPPADFPQSFFQPRIATLLRPAATSTRSSAAEKYPILHAVHVGIIGEFYFGTSGEYSSGIDSAVAILNVGAMDQEADHQSERVDDGVALEALDLLARIKAPDTAAFRGFDALAVDDAGRRRSFLPLQFPRLHDEPMADPGPQARRPPFIEIACTVE